MRRESGLLPKFFPRGEKIVENVCCMSRFMIANFIRIGKETMLLLARELMVLKIDNVTTLEKTNSNGIGGEFQRTQ